MPITCRKLLSLSFLDRKISLSGGSEGLDRVIRWFHAIEGVEEIQFLQNNELVLMTGISIGSDDKKILAMLKGIYEKHGAGLIINTGRYIHNIPQDVIDYANMVKIPVFSVPWDIKLGNMTRKIGELILAERSKYKNVQGLVKKMLFSDTGTGEKIFDTALFDDHKLQGVKQVMLVEFKTNQLDCIDEPEEKLSVLFQEITAEYGQPCFFTWNGNEAAFIIGEYSKSRQFPSALHEKLFNRFSLNVFIGIGGSYQDFSDMRKSHKEAHFALNIAKKSSDRTYVAYKDTNIFRLFYYIDDAVFIKNYYEEVLGDLLRYDKKNSSEFTRTLEIYLEENEDAAATIKRLFIHRNTLTYRLKRIEEITGCRMDDSETRLNFRIAFKMKTFLNFIQ
ncbi:PucR family transcriptional regulator [Pectinatus haikarae]|uniref:PucR family transcriptional regulator n=1 Tax=Pectinatus haikarae TaxID=349096 RepID=A0ABT9Y6M6_9FIRM|nr:PucR family transcriptional regulator [Pectinatus haikarae]MDQ0203206.1 hypothetical protein [Pectinatus haikarae]